MAKGQEYSAYQRKVIDRYYEHMDTASLQRLGELVSDLYLSEPHEARAQRAWKSVEGLLAKVGVEADRAARIAQDRNVERLAELVNELNDPKRKAAKKPSTPPAANNPTPAAAAAPALSPSPTAPTAPTASTPAAPQPAAASAPGASQADASAEPTADVLKSALKAFRKRLKLTRLDEESKLGRSPLSAGGRSNIVAIAAPSQFPQRVWDELVRQGKLKPAGRGFYQLIE